MIHAANAKLSINGNEARCFPTFKHAFIFDELAHQRTDVKDVRFSGSIAFKSNHLLGTFLFGKFAQEVLKGKTRPQSPHRRKSIHARWGERKNGVLSGRHLCIGVDSSGGEVSGLFALFEKLY